MLTNEYLLQILYSIWLEGTFVKLNQQLSQPHLSGGAKWKNLLDLCSGVAMAFPGGPPGEPKWGRKLVKFEEK